MHKFIPMLLVGQNNGILLAYELEDVSPRDHLFQLGMPSCYPPYPEIGDVVIVRNSSDRSFSMAVMRSVSTPTFTIDSQVEEKSKRKAITTRLLCGYDVFGHVGMGRCVELSKGLGPLRLQRPSLDILLKEFWTMPKLLIITMGNLLNGYGKT
jgi:hypothetical protein